MKLRSDGSDSGDGISSTVIKSTASIAASTAYSILALFESLLPLDNCFV